MVLLLALCSLSACSEETYDDGFEDGYDMGYSDAQFKYEDDYFEGISRAQNAIEVYLEDDMYHISHDIKDEYGIYPEEAIGILEEFLDDPNAVSERDLHNAIYAIRRYYYDSHETVNGIDDYWID